MKCQFAWKFFMQMSNFIDIEREILITCYDYIKYISKNIKYSYSQVGSGPHGEAALMIIMLLSQISLTFSSGKIPKCLNRIDAKGQRLLI